MRKLQHIHLFPNLKQCQVKLNVRLDIEILLADVSHKISGESVAERGMSDFGSKHILPLKVFTNHPLPPNQWISIETLHPKGQFTPSEFCAGGKGSSAPTLATPMHITATDCMSSPSLVHTFSSLLLDYGNLHRLLPGSRPQLHTGKYQSASHV